MDKKNKIQYGLTNVHYAVVTETTTEGVTKSTYSAPVRWPGAVSISLDPQGEDTPFYADNIIYDTITGNSGYEAEFECALIPEEIDTEVLGQTKTTDGVILESSEDKKKYIALLFEFEGDIKKRKMVFYRTMLSRPTVEGKTKEDSVEPTTNKISMKITPRPDVNVIDGEERHLIKGYTSADIDAEAYANWYKKVYEVTPAA